MRRFAWVAMCLAFLAAGCSPTDAPREGSKSSETYDVTLEMPTADGLRRGDALVHEGKKVGEVVRVRPFVDRVRADIRFSSGFRLPSGSAFALERDGDDRLIRIVGGGESRPSSGQAVARVSPDALDDRLWAAK